MRRRPMGFSLVGPVPPMPRVGAHRWVGNNTPFLYFPSSSTFKFGAGSSSTRCIMALSSSSTNVQVNAISASTVPLAIQAYSSQTADIQEWQSSTPTTLARVTAAGEVNGPIAPIYTALTGTTTLTASQDLIDVSAASAGWTLTLPAAAGVKAGHEFIIKKTDNNSNAIASAAVSDKIDGASSYSNLSAQYKYLRINSDGVANWMITGSN